MGCSNSSVEVIMEIEDYKENERLKKLVIKRTRKKKKNFKRKIIKRKRKKGKRKETF